MPYYIYTVTVKDQATLKKAALVNEFEKFKAAKSEARLLTGIQEHLSHG